MSLVIHNESWSVKICNSDTPADIIATLAQLPPDTELVMQTYEFTYLSFIKKASATHELLPE